MILETKQILSILMLMGTVVVILFWSKEAARLLRILQDEIDNFSGRGPRPPTHPMPSNDTFLLNRRNRRTACPSMRRYLPWQ